MSAPLRVIDTGEMSARWNVAMTAVLTELHRTGEIPDTLRFHRYPASVLIGRHQVLGQSVHVDRCHAAGIELARRVTGGGAVFMAPGALAWDLVVARRTVGADLKRAAATIGEALASSLARLGLATRYRPENEIEIAGRKICGMSGYFDGGTLVYQGTIMADTSLVDMAQVLKLPLKARYLHRNLAERLMTVAEVLGRKPDSGEIEGAIAAGLSHALGWVPTYEAATAKEMRLAEEWHVSEFGSDAFVNSVNPVGRDKTMFGRDGRVEAYIRVFPGADRLIDRIWLTGNFTVLPSRVIPDLEVALRGTPVRLAPDRTIEILSGDNIEMRGISCHDVAGAIAKARTPRTYSSRRAVT